MATHDAPRVRLVTRDMVYGPQAVARQDGKVVFVRGAAPDEEVDALIREQRRSFAFADTVEVVRPSPQRRPPPCPYLPACGGCPWQHLTYEAQLAAKQRIVAEQLRRIGGIDTAVAPVLPSPREFGCRGRIKLRVDRGTVGFYAAGSHVLVPVEHCLLAESEVDAGIGCAEALVRGLSMRLRRVELLGRPAAGDGAVVVGEIEGRWDARDEPACRDWLARYPAVRGLALHGRGWRRRWGDVRVCFEPERGLSLTAHAPGFTQVNPAANQLLVATVVASVEPQPSQQILDLYAGAGNLSLPLRRRGTAIIAVEQERGAAADAVANGERYPGPPLRVIAARAEQALERLEAEHVRADAVVLDPPRSGAAGCIPALLRLAPPRIVYVACDPTTLARDLAGLRTRYQIDAVQPIDMFPHTYHVEIVVRASLV